MIRGVGLRGAVSLNVIAMIGIGPLITIPLVLAQLAGPLALVGWIAGALVSLCDGLVWAELGSRYPSSGGTYVYLREIFGSPHWGKLFAFLYNWQFFLSSSLVISTGYIGFANYAGYLFPALASLPLLNHAVALCVGLVTIALLYRRITSIAYFGVALAVVATMTLAVVAAAGYWHADFHRAFTVSSPVSFGLGFFAALGGALYVTLYDYAGYSSAALIAEECVDAHRTVPLAIVISILLVFVLYVVLQIGVLGAVPWQSLVGRAGAPPPPEAQYVASTVVANSWGPWAARAVTILILITAFASVYGGLLGASRVPFAAARDGSFIPAFARLHPTKHFPYVSLLSMGAISLVACFFDLGFVIAVIGTSSILIGSIAQILALMLMRARGQAAPFRMWLYPVPALIALAGWILAFANTGTRAIELGVGWLILGLAAYLVTAHRRHVWPFATAALLLCVAVPRPALTSQWPGSSIAYERGYPVYTVDGKPFFVYGAAFFYERIPRDRWKASLDAYHALGINTIDLYVIWNWHEIADGRFDFTGTTNPRRDLRTLLSLIDHEGFKIIVRPGPVIRNEWRNGGYPAWLLRRPAYRMPLRDVLEGRYPATATLQNAHADAAAAEWLRNQTHMRFASRWLRRVLHEIAPWSRDVIAIAVDDDQGAYIDNQTWPAPHWRQYVQRLSSVLRGVVGAGVPLFINTYELKVTPSSPVWAWGNWYQSDAYSIGEHDRSQLEFSTGLLATQPRYPVMISEFQAGWLQGADEAQPRPADPSNTTLALHTLLQNGAHGVVNFPVQDTLNPAGWEAPWANAFYSWDAALAIQLVSQQRFVPTRRFGEAVQRYGDLLAQTHPAIDAAIAYTTSAYDAGRLSNSQVARIAQATMQAQAECRSRRFACALVDLRYASVQQLHGYPGLILPRAGIALPYIGSVRDKLRTLRDDGEAIVSTAQALPSRNSAAAGIPDAALLVDARERFGFLDVVNYGRRPLRIAARTLHWQTFEAAVAAFSVPPRDAVLVPLGAAQARKTELARLPPAAAATVPLRPGSDVTASLRAPPRGQVTAYAADFYRDGYSAVVLQTARVAIVVSPCAGARALIFEDLPHRQNLVTIVGAFRDAWTPQLAPSARDYIAPYTHPIAAGTFNRCYSARILRSGAQASASFSYTAPDAPPRGASFSRTMTLDGKSNVLAVQLHAAFRGRSAERAAQLTSFALSSSTRILRRIDAYGFYDESASRVFAVAWRPAEIKAKQLSVHAHDALLTLMLERVDASTRYAVFSAGDLSQAQAALSAFANRR